MNKSTGAEILTLYVTVFSVSFCLYAVKFALDVNTLTDKPDKALIITFVASALAVFAIVALTLVRLRNVVRSAVQQIACQLEVRWNFTHHIKYRIFPFFLSYLAIVLAYIALFAILSVLTALILLLLSRNNPESQWTVLFSYFDVALRWFVPGFALLHMVISTIRLANFLRVLDQEYLLAVTTVQSHQ